MNADQILVLGKGRILEKGTHAELLKLDGTYSELWTKQITGKSALHLLFHDIICEWMIDGDVKFESKGTS